MSVLIKGMEMPKGNSTINVLIYADGTVYTGHVNDSQYSAIAVPTPHGRLIDGDICLEKAWRNLYKHQDKRAKKDGEFYIESGLQYENDGFNVFQRAILNAPTVIESEEVYNQYTDTIGRHQWAGIKSGIHHS